MIAGGWSLCILKTTNRSWKRGFPFICLLQSVQSPKAGAFLMLQSYHAHGSYSTGEPSPALPLLYSSCLPFGCWFEPHRDISLHKWFDSIFLQPRLQASLSASESSLPQSNSTGLEEADAAADLERSLAVVSVVRLICFPHLENRVVWPPHGLHLNDFLPGHPHWEAALVPPDFHVCQKICLHVILGSPFLDWLHSNRHECLCPHLQSATFIIFN